jgi:catecholate siderophore receptor
MERQLKAMDGGVAAQRLPTKAAKLGPVGAETYVAGVKTRWIDNRLSVTAAIFHTEADNAQTDAPEDPTITSSTANSASTKSRHLCAVTRRVEIVAGYTSLHGRIIEAGAVRVLEGGAGKRC